MIISNGICICDNLLLGIGIGSVAISSIGGTLAKMGLKGGLLMRFHCIWLFIYFLFILSSQPCWCTQENN